MDHKMRMEKAKEIVEKIKNEGKEEKGINSTEWFLALEEERK